MRSRMRPTYAKLFEGFSEPKFFSKYYGPKPELYGRYIDDCIGASSLILEGRTRSFYRFG